MPSVTYCIWLLLLYYVVWLMDDVERYLRKTDAGVRDLDYYFVLLVDTGD